MTGRCPLRTRLLALAGAVLALVLASAVPAAAHAGDPTLVTRLYGVEPGLPAGVTVDLVTTIADQLVVTNPSDVPLEVVGPDGAGFLRISAAGVAGNVASPYLHLFAAPAGVPVAVPDTAREGATARWVPLSDEPSWAWFDARSSPPVVQVPVGGRSDASEVAELAVWTVPLRFGGTAVEVRGALVRRPVTGRFETTLDPAPAGVNATIGQGYFPWMSLRAGPGREVVVFGRAGEPFLRLGPERSEVSRDSATHREDLLSRGTAAGPADTGWAPLPAATPKWVDTRLRYPAEDPPAEFADTEVPVEIARWEIPVSVDGDPRALTGSIRWLPDGRAAGGGTPWTTAATGGGIALLLAVGAALMLRGRRLRNRSQRGPATAE